MNIRPIPEIFELARDLKNSGYIVGVVSSNSVENINSFIEKNNSKDIFSFVHSSRNLFEKNREINKIIKQKKP